MLVGGVKRAADAIAVYAIECACMRAQAWRGWAQEVFGERDNVVGLSIWLLVWELERVLVGDARLWRHGRRLHVMVIWPVASLSTHLQLLLRHVLDDESDTLVIRVFLLLRRGLLLLLAHLEEVLSKHLGPLSLLSGPGLEGRAEHKVSLGLAHVQEHFLLPVELLLPDSAHYEQEEAAIQALKDFADLANGLFVHAEAFAAEDCSSRLLELCVAQHVQLALALVQLQDLLPWHVLQEVKLLLGALGQGLWPVGLQLGDHHFVFPDLPLVQAHVLRAMALLEGILLAHPVSVDVENGIDHGTDVAAG